MARSRIPHEVDTAKIEKSASAPEVAIFAKTFNQLLVEKEIHQDDLADALGISTGSISSYRNGKKEPRLSMIVKIANYLGVDCHYLMTGIHADNAPEAKEIGLSDTAINKTKAFQNKAALSAVLESRHFFALIDAILRSVKYADNRGHLIVEHIVQILRGQDDTIPAEDMDAIFKYKAIDSAGKLFDEISARLYDEKRRGRTDSKKD